ncbi:MAG: hypothetical protein RL110_580 [Bacteroidota bacterium]|jgi:pantetheine-phosphate adenylyltransferase|nr:pantetheine-phosphate adenylyltransferase [Flavobacteriia bacterium]
MKRAFFPGSFDPFTKGHEAIVHKGLDLFDEIIIAIGMHSTKQPLFALSQREQHIRSIFTTPRVTIISFTGLTVDACKKHGCSQILRGLRDTKDFQYERSIAHMNHSLGGIETVFLLTDLTYSAINSTIVREIYWNKGDIAPFVTNAQLLINEP